MDHRLLSADALGIPSGLSPSLWERRHVRILYVLLAHVPVLVAIAAIRGFGAAHIAVDVAMPMACLVLAARRSMLPRLRSIAAALGLMAAAAAFVHLTGGRTESHFLYFVLLGVLALYEDWVPYAAAVLFVLLEHGVLGIVAPSTIYTDGNRSAPWLWAGVHGGFVLAASLVALVSWRWREADRAEADTKLRISEEHFRLSFEGAPIGMALVGADGRFLEVNQSLCEIVGYDRRHLMATTFQAITHPDDLDADLSLLQTCLDGRSDGYVMEKRYVHRLGHPVWIQLNVAVARDAHGELTHLIAQILDISERRAAAASEARFAAVVEHSSDVISIADQNGRLLYASPAFKTVLGFTPEERIGHSLEDQVHPEDRAGLAAAMWALGDGHSAMLRYRHAHADGSWRWVEATMTNRVDDAAVGGFVVNTRDVSEQVQATERLAHQATHDVLTGLANRSLLDERLVQATGAADRRGETLAAFFVDIDHFKHVNDTMGHAAGDELLGEVASRLRQAARRDDTIARVGGDEFVIVASLTGHGSVAELAGRVCHAFEEPFSVGGRAVPVTVSVGVATTDCTSGVAGLIEAADTALYDAKARGRNRWVLYQPTIAPLAAAPEPQATSG
jgi:diguanylate cyclase (GGDEF)-like protein/PAS domain S-box-containing protein